ncbi:ABC transporter substrate-binding protein [Caulobacter sp. S45]|uniref:ABC transporter substrate-binding protein n=1 Tax=Caulobacter sp. S45 TaxID=1641861 RepID=UPI00131BB3AA|nr:ABC transporter substrate-binding protein [Caulobacter sp. S45]
MWRASLSFALLALCLLGSPHLARAAPANAITVGLQLEPPTLDPTSGAADAIKNVAFPTLFEGLVKLGPGGVVQPLLAQSWTVSPDGQTYSFHLRRGVQFSDGEPFDATVVKFSLDRARAPGSTNGQRSRFEVIDQVRILDPYEVELHLKRRSATLLQVLGWGDAVMVAPGSAKTDITRPVGTGPFVLEDWRRGYSVSLKRNPAYWGRPARLERVTFTFIADPSAAEAALRAGDVDVFPNYPAPEGLKRLAADPRFVVRSAPSEGETLVALNERIKPLADVRVRRALAYAIDRRAVIEGAMYGFGTPIGSHYPPQDPGYVDLTGLYPHDPAKARALLAQAGYPHLGLTLTLPPPTYARRSGEIVAAQLAQAGVKVKIVDMEWAQWLAQVFGRHAYDMTIVDHVEPLDYDIYGRDDYYFGYSNPRTKVLLAAAEDATDPARRTALLGGIQRQIAGDSVNLFLFQYPILGVWNARLRDAWAPTPVAILDLNDAYVAGGGAGDEQGGSGATPAWLWVLTTAPFVLALIAAGRRARPAYLAGRLGVLVGTLLAASLVIFLLLQIAPGDPARYMMGFSADPAALHAVRLELGLEGPAWRRYLSWMAGLAHGDLGLSYTYRTPVAALVAERLAVSLPLALYALVLSTTAAFAMGLGAAMRPGGTVDRIVGGLTQLGVAVPGFWLGMMLVIVFAERLGWAPAGGFPGWAGGVGPALGALSLPAIALAAPQAAVLTRVLRGELLSAMGADYVRSARARGLSRRQALIRHALPNALGPTLTILGLQFAYLLAGAVVIENVFNLPGLGRLVFQALAQRDLIVVQSVVLVLVVAVVAVSFLTDLAAAAVDPRLSERRR